MVDLEGLSNREVLDLWARSSQTVYERRVVRTYNSPIGDIAEEMVARHYDAVHRSLGQAA